MKHIKKILISLLIVFVLILGALVAIPYFYKDEIVAAVKTAANENLTASVDFKDVDISVFRHFPKLSVGLEGLEVTGTGAFEGVKLVQCERLDVAVDLWGAIMSDKIAINQLYFKKPDIKVYVLSDGQANYDITKPDPTATSSSTDTGESSPIQLEKYVIEDGKILYDDRGLDMRLEIEALNHSGSGEFTSDIYDFVMKTDAGKLSVNYGGMQYLSKAKAEWDATLGADMKQMKFTFKENEMKVNAMDMALDGWVALPNDVDITMDLTFGSKRNTFKDLLSIIPGAYTADFNDVQAAGGLQFAGFVKGKYNETTYPAFSIGVKVDNGNFKYPSLPLGVSDINVDLSIKSPSERLNDMTINIPAFNLRIGSNPISGRFFLKTPESNPTVDTRINGTLNLAELSKAFPMDGVSELAGIIKADITAKASMSQIDQQQYEQVQMLGNFDMQQITYRAAGTPTIQIKALESSLSPQRVDIRNFDARLGRSDLKASGSIDNILAYFSTNKTMTGTMNFSAAFFDANEWMEPEAATTGTANTASSKVPSETAAAPSEKVFDRWDFTVDGEIGRLKYDVYDLSNMRMKGHFKPNKMDISDFGLKIGESDLSGNGRILNAWNYLFDNQTVAGEVNLKSNYFDLNQFMEETPATGSTGTATSSAPAAEATGVIPVPENMDMTLHANMGKVRYTTYELNNLDGTVVVRDKVAKIEDCTANAFGGLIGLAGEYNTQDLSKPSYNIDLALQNMGFKEAYKNFVTVQKLSPIANLMDGKFNTNLSMSGLLGQDMTPDLNTLSAAGFLETISAILSNFKPTQDIANKLNMPYLSRLELGNTKNWFEIKNGAVSIKPFNVQVRDVAMQIGGTHSISQEMNYQIVTKTPRSAMQKNAVGSGINSGLSFLSGEASKYGVNIAQGEFINVRFDLTGSIASPKVAIKVLGSDGERSIQEEAGSAAQATIDKAKDTLSTIANQKLDEAKAKAKAAADKAADSLRNLANQKINDAANKAKEEVAKRAGEEIGQKAGEAVGKKAEEALGDQGKKTVDDVKNKLDKWDPFKKKKSGGN